METRFVAHVRRTNRPRHFSGAKDHIALSNTLEENLVNDLVIPPRIVDGHAAGCDVCGERR